MFNAILQIHAALLSAILEHTGYLQSYLSSLDISVSFKDCCKLVILLFSKEEHPQLQKDIESSTHSHLYNIQHQLPPKQTHNRWVSTIEISEYVQMFQSLDIQWTNWNPTDTCSKTYKEFVVTIV